MNLADTLKNKNCADEVAILYRNSFGGHVVNFLASTVLAFAFINESVQQSKLIWWSLMTALITFRFVDSCYWTFFLGGKVKPEQAGKAKSRFFVLMMLTAVFWVIYPFLVFHSLDLVEFTSTVIIYAAMAGGAVTMLSPHRIGSMIYCTLMLWPLSLLSYFSNDATMQILGVMGIAYAVVILITASKSSEFTAQAISLKNENAELLAEVQHEKEIVKESNLKLKKTLEQLNQSHKHLEYQISQRTREIATLNNRDSLTGLLNRKALIASLDEKIEEGIAKSIGFCVFFIDLNGFKVINDTLGHEIGDQVLERVADGLLDLRPDIDVGRWGGDEFVVILSHAEIPEEREKVAEETMKFAHRLIAEVRNVNVPGKKTYNLDAAVGISYFPKDSIQSDELIRRADIAMCDQKYSNGDKPIEFYPELLARIEEIERIRIGLGHAIEKQEFSLVYQPIVNTGIQKIVRYEALLRWRFGDKNVPPCDFIHIAEDSGLIVEIGEWVLMQACLAASKWQRFNDASVSVNVSTMQLLNSHFVSSVESALLESQLPPSKLNLEITESVLCSNIEHAKTVLEAVKKLGVTIAIDDFGTGYSSLSQIEQLPINCIKVDRYFVANMNTNGGVVLRATTMMAKEMSLNIVAEGIETAEQLKALHAIGLETFQGYFFAKPLPENQIEHYACEQLSGILQQAS